MAGAERPPLPDRGLRGRPTAIGRGRRRHHCLAPVNLISALGSGWGRWLVREPILFADGGLLADQATTGAATAVDTAHLCPELRPDVIPEPLRLSTPEQLVAGGIDPRMPE